MNRGKRDCKNYIFAQHLALLTDLSAVSVEPESVAEWKEYLERMPQRSEFYDIRELLGKDIPAIDWPTTWARATQGDYEDEDLEDIEEQKDDLADEDNEGLNLEDVEDLAPSMTRPGLSMNADIMTYMAQFIPEGARALYESSLSALVAQVKNTLPPSGEEHANLENRFELFKYCMSVMIDNLKMGRTWAINELASWTLEDWQKLELDDTIDSPFSVDEMTSFCCRLDKQRKIK